MLDTGQLAEQTDGIFTTAGGPQGEYQMVEAVKDEFIWNWQ